MSKAMYRGLIVNVEAAQKCCEYLINSTPTSDRRNALTEINIKLMMLIEEVKKVPPLFVDTDSSTEKKGRK